LVSYATAGLPSAPTALKPAVSIRPSSRSTMLCALPMATARTPRSAAVPRKRVGAAAVALPPLPSAPKML
jgi:hypothetical protein